MTLLLRYLSRSRSVHAQGYEEAASADGNKEDDGERLYRSTSTRVNKVVEYELDPQVSGCNNTIFTVWNKSLLVSCNGFTVFDCNGKLVYRVDNYMENPGKIVLMDSDGFAIHSIQRRKKLNLRDDWLVYDGDEAACNYQQQSSKQTTSSKKKLHFEKKLPICHVRKNVNILQTGNRYNEIANVFLGKMRSPAYEVEGSYRQRSCKVFDKSRRKVVAEIKRKEAMVNGKLTLFGSEVFHLVVYPGFDPGFAMTIVLLLDQMFG